MAGVPEFDIVLNYVLVHLFYAPENQSGPNLASLAAADTFSGRKILPTAIEQTAKHIIRDYLLMRNQSEILRGFTHIIPLISLVSIVVGLPVPSKSRTDPGVRLLDSELVSTAI